jgi:hypothetical protein
MRLNLGSKVENLTPSILGDVDLRDLVLEKIVIKEFHVNHLLHWLFVVENIPSRSKGNEYS